MDREQLKQLIKEVKQELQEKVTVLNKNQQIPKDVIRVNPQATALATRQNPTTTLATQQKPTTALATQQKPGELAKTNNPTPGNQGQATAISQPAGSQICIDFNNDLKKLFITMQAELTNDIKSPDANAKKIANERLKILDPIFKAL